jgi:hypothetical protein
MYAAEADPRRFGHLVEQMDQNNSVNAAYKEFQAAGRSAAAAVTGRDSSTEQPSTTRISVAALNEAFPEYPVTIEDKGWILGMWYCGGQSWQKCPFYEQYPPTFLRRALALFPGAKQIVHCPSGTVTGPGLTIDLIRDHSRRPQIVANAAAIPLATASTDLVLSDPPYTKEDAKVYGTPPFPMDKFMAEASRVLRRGGYLGMLHTRYPNYRSNELKLVAQIGVVTGPCRIFRVFSIFERL